jgi:transcriptional regulator with XRE-family HTH domain
MASGSLGQRLAAYRRRRGLSQATLAGLVGRSESWMSQVERGLRTVDRLSVLTDLAAVLRVSIETLTGSPPVPVRRSLVPVGLDPVRQFFTSHEGLSVGPVDLRASQADVAARISAAHRQYQNAEYDRLIGELPALLAAAEAARCAGREALPNLASAYVVAAKLLTKIGIGDLALLAADRSAMAAAGLESLAARGSAAYQVTCALLRTNRSREAEDLAVRMAERMQAHGRSSAPSLISMAGSLWLIAAVIAGRRHDRQEAMYRLDAAQRLADLLGDDGNHGWTAFGPTNVAIHRVSVTVGTGDAGQAVRDAAQIDLDRLPVGLTSRRIQVHLDLAAAQVQRRSQADALLHLLEGERISPQALRYNASAQRLMREMLARTTQSTTPALQNLATRVGVLD